MGCQRRSHFPSADMTASSASSSYCVRSATGQASRSDHNCANSNAPSSSAARNVTGRCGGSLCLRDWIMVVLHQA